MFSFTFSKVILTYQLMFTYLVLCFQKSILKLIKLSGHAKRNMEMLPHTKGETSRHAKRNIEMCMIRRSTYICNAIGRVSFIQTKTHHLNSLTIFKLVIFQIFSKCFFYKKSNEVVFKMLNAWFDKRCWKMRL